ncbi:hypothetical protein ACOSQ4_013374 [Xanthoceras sorbifolium]
MGETQSKNFEREGGVEKGGISASEIDVGITEKSSGDTGPFLEESLSEQIQGVVLSKTAQQSGDLGRVETGFTKAKGISEGGTSTALNEGEVSSGISCSNREKVFDSVVVKDRVELKRNICPGVDTSDDRSLVGEVKETDSFEFISAGGASSFSSEGELSSIQHLEASEVCNPKQKKWKRLARAKRKMSLGGRSGILGKREAEIDEVDIHNSKRGRGISLPHWLIDSFLCTPQQENYRYSFNTDLQD